MRCPKCREKMKVTYSKPIGTIRKRVYICPCCGLSVITTETIDQKKSYE